MSKWKINAPAIDATSPQISSASIMLELQPMCIYTTELVKDESLHVFIPYNQNKNYHNVSVTTLQRRTGPGSSEGVHEGPLERMVPIGADDGKSHTIALGRLLGPRKPMKKHAQRLPAITKSHVPQCPTIANIP